MENAAGNRRMYHMEIRRTDGETRVPLDVLAESEDAAQAQIPADFVLVRFTERYSWPEITPLEA